MIQQGGEIISINNHSMLVVFPEMAGEECGSRRALRCGLAIAMIAYQMRFWIRQAFPEYGLDRFGVGLGMHRGKLMLAEIGHAPYVQRVVSGHAVSVAGLLAVKSKELGWNIVCSAQVLDAGGEGVKTRSTSTVGADWLREPVRVVEIAVVRDGNPEINSMAATLKLRDVKPGGATGKFRALGTLPSVPGYRCIQPIGQGGHSRVYLVERMRDGLHLALKFSDGKVSEDSEVLYRFVEEYGLLEQVKHPHVLQILDQGVTDDALFIVMEYLPGGTLKQKIGSQGLDKTLALQVLRQMLQALVEIHRQGIVHRDIKPENILLRADGSAVLADFGVAKQIYKGTGFAGLEEIVGTPYFMSPEQAEGLDEDDRTDIYSLGAVLYNMLTGQKPYVGESLEEIAQQHLHAPIPKLPQKYGYLQEMLERMMAKDPIRRQRAQDVLHMMDRLESAPG